MEKSSWLVPLILISLYAARYNEVKSARTYVNNAIGSTINTYKGRSNSNISVGST